MNDYIFYVSQKERKPDYLIETFIYKNSPKYIIKRALDKKAETHIKNISSNANDLLKIYKNSELNIVLPVKTMKNEVHFPIIQGKILEREFLDYILDDDRQSAKMIIEKLINVIKVIAVKPQSKSNILGIVNEAYPNTYDCLAYAPIDCNLDNIIVDSGNNWNLIDYEFCYNQNVPISYIVLRPLVYFSSRYSDLLRLHSDRLDIIELAENLLLPSYLVNIIEPYLKELKNLYHSEYLFQKEVNIHTDKYKNTEIYDDYKKIRFEDKTSEYLEKFSTIKDEFDTLKNNYQQLLKKAEILEQSKNELHEIKNSKSYKFMTKAKKPIDKLRK